MAANVKVKIETVKQEDAGLVFARYTSAETGRGLNGILNNRLSQITGNDTGKITLAFAGKDPHLLEGNARALLESAGFADFQQEVHITPSSGTILILEIQDSSPDAVIRVARALTQTADKGGKTYPSILGSRTAQQIIEHEQARHRHDKSGPLPPVAMRRPRNPVGGNDNK